MRNVVSIVYREDLKVCLFKSLGTIESRRSRVVETSQIWGYFLGFLEMLSAFLTQKSDVLYKKSYSIRESSRHLVFSVKSQYTKVVCIK